MNGTQVRARDEARQKPSAAPAPTDRGPRSRLGLARAALAWEQLWPALWPAAGIAGLFLVLALFNLLPLLDGWLHALILLLFVLALAAALVIGLRRVRLPDEAAALRRLERDSGLPHRPLLAVRDRLAGAADPATAELWRLYQKQARQRIRSLKLRMPHPNLAARDPWGLRAAVGLLLFIAGFGTWGDWGPRIGAALTPQFAGAAAAAAAALDIWVTPPDYTGIAPIFLRPDAQGAPPDTLSVPAGSVVLARVNGGSTLPHLVADGGVRDFDRVDQASFQISQPVTRGTVIAVEQGSRTLGSWPVTVVPDQAPTIALPTPPAAGERGALRLEYEARDDYGIAGVTGTFRLSGDPEPGLNREPIELALPLPGVRPKEARNTSFHDLTPHPWAGLPVTLRLSAADGAGQTGRSEELSFVLPEREFRHPVARAIVEERKQLTLQPQSAREDVARTLAILSARPGLFNDDLTVYLALRTAVARLHLDDTPEAVPEIQQLLWDTALRIEDGQLSIAERALRDAEQRLSDALNRDATDQELRQLLDELQTALDQFLDAMEQQMREALERGEPMPQIPPEMQGQMMDRQDLQQMLDQMRQMAETGARDAARQMLSQLQQMLENLRNGNMAQMQQGQMGQMGQMLSQLQDLARQQQELLDQTFRDAQEQDPSGQQGDMQGQMQMPGQGQMPGQTPGRQPRPGQRGQQGQQGQMGQQGQPSGGAAQQEALRRQLGELMRQFGEMGGEIPRPLGRAERAMRDAGQALSQGQPGAAVPPQTQALDELQQGMQAMAEEMAQQMMMGQMPGQMPGQQRQQSNRGRDPLGRPLPGFGSADTNDVDIPEQSELQRAREILDELRRRAGEFSRPKPELDYIDRLLRRF
jgi:uncharacterized protein (TIGR02302 family)